jgi:hypothetical protein
MKSQTYLPRLDPVIGDNIGLRLVRTTKASTFTMTLSKESKELQNSFSISAIGVANEEWVSRLDAFGLYSSDTTFH